MKISSLSNTAFMLRAWHSSPQEADNAWRYYNRIDGEVIDFIETQVPIRLIYLDVQSNREEAFTDTIEEQYKHLTRLKEILESTTNDNTLK